MPAILDKILRIGEGKILRQLEAVAKAVNAIEDDYVAMSDDELRGQTDLFRKRLEEGERGEVSRRFAPVTSMTVAPARPGLAAIADASAKPSMAGMSASSSAQG